MITLPCETEPLSDPDPLADRVDSALETSPYLSRCLMRFETNEGRVVLRGKVTSYFQKQMAQETVRRLDGVEAVDNLLEVSW
jgi:osmotically-inducible protein OsmY